MVPVADTGRHPLSVSQFLKFEGLAVQKIWRTMSVSINGLGNLDL